MKHEKNRRNSHKIWLLGALMLPLAGCNGGISGVTPTGYQDAYRVSLTSLGYSATGGGTTPRVYTIPSVTAKLVSTAGAPDVRELDYTAVLLDSNGNPATVDNSKIVPATGVLLTGAKGGYACATTPEITCTAASSDATWVNNGSWSVNNLDRSIVPIEWAVANDTGTTGETSQWYAEFTYSAVMSTGQSVSWKQRYQFVSPTGSS